MSNEPQAGITQVLRPPPNFTTLYAGANPATQPIYLFPDGQQRDPLAGQPGYDPNLVNALRVPLGSQLEIWLPNLAAIVGVDPVTLAGYHWVLQFRLRSAADFKRVRKPYHLKLAVGTADTSSGTPQSRIVIPSAYVTAIFPGTTSTPPNAPDAGRGQNNLRAEDLIAQATQFSGPIIAPGVEGAIQQGVSNPASDPTATRPKWLTWQVPAHGDELILGVYRDQGEAPVWAFTEGGAFPANADASLAAFFANEAIGAYVTVGTADGFQTPRSPMR